MKKEEKTSKIKKKKEEKYKLVDAERLKKVELIISLIVGVIFLVLLVLSIINVVFLPATLILFALFLFSFVINYILVFDFNYKISSREYILFSDEVLNNGDNLSREELEKMSYDDKKELAGRYSAAYNNEKSKEISFSFPEISL